MASLHMLQAALLLEVQKVAQAAIVGGTITQIKSAIGWPGENDLQEIARAPNHLALISIYDRKISKNSTRWSPYASNFVVTEATLESAVSLGVIPPLGTSHITLSQEITPYDAVSAVMTNVATLPATTAAQVVIASPTDTLDSIAANLAAAIAADPVLSAWVTATASGAVITITSKLSIGQIVLESYTGNNGQRTMELERRQRQLQITVWTRTEEERIAVTGPIEVLIAQMGANFGLQMSDGSLARILYVNDHYIEDATLEDVLRRDFIVSADYPITAQDMLYSVLAPIPEFVVDQE